MKAAVSSVYVMAHVHLLLVVIILLYPPIWHTPYCLRRRWSLKVIGNFKSLTQKTAHDPIGLP